MKKKTVTSIEQYAESFHSMLVWDVCCKICKNEFWNEERKGSNDRRRNGCACLETDAFVSRSNGRRAVVGGLR